MPFYGMNPKQLFRPVYGEHFESRPKHWWNPRQRKAARLAAALLDYDAPAIEAKIQAAIVRGLVYGEPFVFAAEVERTLKKS